MKRWWNDTDRGNKKYSEKNLSQVRLLCPLQITGRLWWVAIV